MALFARLGYIYAHLHVQALQYRCRLAILPERAAPA
eukprot:COSAG03_NODE_9613_length_706_cov_0.925865_1_plen_35_part_10